MKHPREAMTLPPAAQKRIRELEKQFLERQAATNDVLRLISTSAFDLDTVFKTVITTATRLCRAEHGRIYLLEDNLFRSVASVGEANLQIQPETIDRGSAI